MVTVYFSLVHNIEEIQDSICVGQHKDAGDFRAILFIKMKSVFCFTPKLRDKVVQKMNSELWYESVPQLILETKEILISRRFKTRPNCP
ncbi:hypothetical protein AVEN_253303-1 [Araneus ventricosus]|uniref:Uncharacterized protein n=1 Tax=Araneus ventricosus TaxID=182803 RepID=A0A4Y2W351_ARAVE|nr:hypothetical protein AVEN_253303-1 [Araneus ventricosus]